MEVLLVLLLVFALAALFFAGVVLVGLTSPSKLDSRLRASTHVNRAVLRGDSAEVKKEMERVEREAHSAFGNSYGGSQRPSQRSTRDEIHIGPRGGRYRINSRGRKSYDV